MITGVSPLSTLEPQSWQPCNLKGCALWAQHLTTGRTSPTPALPQVHTDRAPALPFHSHIPLSVQTETLHSPSLLGGLQVGWVGGGRGREEEGRPLCEEPEATSQKDVLVAEGEPRQVGLVPGSPILLPEEVSSVALENLSWCSSWPPQPHGRVAAKLLEFTTPGLGRGLLCRHETPPKQLGHGK